MKRLRAPQRPRPRQGLAPRWPICRSRKRLGRSPSNRPEKKRNMKSLPRRRPRLPPLARVPKWPTCPCPSRPKLYRLNLPGKRQTTRRPRPARRQQPPPRALDPKWLTCRFRTRPNPSVLSLQAKRPFMRPRRRLFLLPHLRPRRPSRGRRKWLEWKCPRVERRFPFLGVMARKKNQPKAHPPPRVPPRLQRSTRQPPKWRMRPLRRSRKTEGSGSELQERSSAR